MTPIPGGGSVIETCECQLEQRVTRLLHRASIPPRYEHCTLDDYHADLTDADPSLRKALMMARGFVNSYPVDSDGQGLLFTGPVGVGKTHLAVGILRALIGERGAHGLFCDYRELLKEIQHSYNAQVATTELEILRPVFDAEVLVLDELGAAKPTDWVWDTVALVLNTRYNDKRTTIITTNFPLIRSEDSSIAGPTRGNDRPMREETLKDRIGERMLSRLSEMCVAVEMNGKDFRQSVKKARFG
jgi:DNA replication protein DnaC